MILTEPGNLQIKIKHKGNQTQVNDWLNENFIFQKRFDLESEIIRLIDLAISQVTEIFQKQQEHWAFQEITFAIASKRNQNDIWNYFPLNSGKFGNNTHYITFEPLID